MKKITSIVLFVVTLQTLHAQNLDQGRKFLYYQRYISAKAQFEKLLASNPNNIDAVYWLGQTLIGQKDSLAAKDVYQKALASNGNAPLLLAGIGQIELMENKTNEARQRFETAISLSKSKDINVLNAVGRANVYAVLGDANYAVEKINSVASEKKDPRNADSYLIVGEAYRKLIDGGAAVTNFQKALSLDPKLAEAKYRIAKVYQSQNNPDYFIPAYQEAITLDPNYAPAYNELFTYYFLRDINKSKEYFDKYLAVTDPKPSDDYDRISLLFAARNYQAAVDSAKGKITQLADKADPRYYKLVAYSYDELKDSVNAKTFLDQYFTKQTKEAFVPQDYVFRAKILSKFPGSEADALASYQTAVDLDTSMVTKLELMSEAAAFAGKAGNRAEEANWLAKLYKTKKDPSNRDLYDWGYANYMAGNYLTADSIFCGVYSQKYPTEVFGYLWCAKSASAQDTTMEKGLGVEPYKKLIAFADTAKEKYKATLLTAHSYLAGYYANVAKDKDSAVAQLKSVLELDPANADAQKYIDILLKPAPAPKQASTAKTGTATKTGKAKPAAKKPAAKKK
ncbi:MAG: tetratricopeptide repeat protein [Chitinophagaceae bacterium]